MMRIYPFGKYSILKSDLYNQYINFLCYLREIILHDKSIVISWNLGLANNFYTTFAYYLMSPLNLFVVFFDTSNMDVFVEMVTFIKIALMANFMILFLEKSYGFKKGEAVLFGLIYAYSSYVICYSFHIMWLDPLYMLPIILLYVDKFIKNGKIVPLIASMSYAILTNYYIGYMVAFFAGIYYLARYFTTNQLKIKEFIKSLARFLLAIIISFTIGMIVILPSFLQLKEKVNTDISLIEINLDKIKLLTNVLFNNYVYAFTQKSGFVFSSTLVSVLLPMYYLNKKISSREKIAFTLLIAFLCLPIISPFFNKIWHAFTVPNCFNYRYSFTLIFVLILMAAREFQNIKSSEKWHFIVSFGVFSVLTLIEICFRKRGYLEADGYTISMKSIIISYVIYLIMLGLVYIFFYSEKFIISWKLPMDLFEKHSRKIINIFAKVALFVVVIIDLLIGAKSGQKNDDVYFERWIWTQYDQFMEHFTPKLKNPEIDRIVFIPDEYGSNMSLKFGYSNIGFFSSARNRSTLEAMHRLGYNVQMKEQLWLTSFSGTFLNHCLGGVKYYVTREKLQDNEIYGLEFEEKYGEFYVYKNKNHFNIGYYLADDINQNGNPFEMQNDIVNRLIKTNAEKRYFEKIEKSKILNCKKQIKYDEETQEYTIKYKVKAKKDCNIYLSSENKLNLNIEGKDIFQDYSNVWTLENGIKQIKYIKQNEEIEITITTKKNPELIYIYVSDNEEIQQTLNKRNKNCFELQEIKKNGLTGTANIKDNGYLSFGIAYDKCWKIYVDGKDTQAEPIAGAFLGVKIEKGVHNIELKASMISIK